MVLELERPPLTVRTAVTSHMVPRNGSLWFFFQFKYVCFFFPSNIKLHTYSLLKRIALSTLWRQGDIGAIVNLAMCVQNSETYL